MTPKQTRDALVREMNELADQIASAGINSFSHRVLLLSNRLAALPVGDGEPVAEVARESWCGERTVRWIRNDNDDGSDLLTGRYLCLAPPPAAVPAGFAIEKWLEREAWSFLRNVLTQGQAIEMDYRNNKYESYEHLSARLDEAARERRDQLEAAIAARPDAPTVAAQEWRPIETAPKDEWVLLACGPGGMIEGCKMEGNWVDSYGGEILGANHWMPLPDSPDATAPAGEKGT